MAHLPTEEKTNHRILVSRIPNSVYGYSYLCSPGRKGKGKIGAQSVYLGRKVDRICTFPCIYPYANKVVLYQWGLYCVNKVGGKGVQQLKKYRLKHVL